MATGSLSKVIQRLRHAILLNDENMTDGQLLDCFCSQQEEAAFEALMRYESNVARFHRELLSVPTLTRPYPYVRRNAHFHKWK